MGSFWQFLFRQVMTDFKYDGICHNYNEITCNLFKWVYAENASKEILNAAYIEKYEF